MTSAERSAAIRRNHAFARRYLCPNGKHVAFRTDKRCRACGAKP